MAKINDKFKRSSEEFSNKVKSFTRNRPRFKPPRPINTDSVSSDINNNLKNSKSFIDRFKFKNTSSQSDVADIGINQESLNNKDVLYNTDMSGDAPRKMRRIASSKDSTYSILEGQQKSLSGMYKNQASMMARFHSEKMAITSKYQNESLKYIKNISEQVEQMNKMKNSIQLEFYKNSTTTQSAILEELKTINKTLKTGFNLNERGERVVNKETDSLIKGLFNGSGSIRGRAKQLIMQLAKGEANNAGLGMVSSMATLSPTLLQTMGGIGGLFTAGGKMVLDNIFEGQASKSRMGRQASYLMKDPGKFLEDMFTSMGLTERGIKGWLGKRLGRQGDKVTSAYDISKVLYKDNKGRTSFDMSAHTALTRVITRSLANIESALSGKPAMFYNYETNRFETIEEAEAAIKTGYSPEVKKEMEKLMKSISSNQTIEVENVVGGGTHTKTKYGMWGELLKIKNDVNDANLKFVQNSIKMRGPELGNYLTKLIVFLSKHTSAPEQILDSDIDIKLIMRAIYGDKYYDAPKEMIDKFANAAMSFKMFIEALRDLPTKEGQQIWDRLMKETQEMNDSITNAMDQAFASAEGSVAQWSAYTYGEAVETVTKDGKTKTYMRGKSREELDREFYNSKKDYDFAKMSGMSIDISGITSDWELAERLKDEYNKMMGPLFRGTSDKIKNNLKKKVRDLKKVNHPFAEYMEKFSNAYSKMGDNIFNYDDYKRLEGVHSYTDLEEATKKPRFYGYDISSSIDSAKSIAKWHLENNAKAKGILGGVSTAAYGTLISTMAKNSGMTGPIGSAILGVGAAASMVLSGKMTKVMDVMTTSLGDEKMLDKDGNETNITRRQAMQEAFYRETLPKGIGYGAGMKIGGWVKRNIRFGPILGPIVGLGTGFLLSKTSSLAMKLVGLFGSFGKNLLNSIGKKITGDSYSNWGDTVRDLVREKLGLAPVGSDQFTMKEVLRQSGEKKSKLRNFIETFTGQRGRGTTSSEVTKRPDIEERYKRAREMYKLMQGPKNNPYGTVADTSELGGEIKDPISNVKESVAKTMSSVLNIRIQGGHLDAVGAMGAIDAEAYKTKLNSISKSVSDQLNKTAKGEDKKDVDTIKSNINFNINNAMSFMTNDKEMKHNMEEQDRQEAIEEENRENIRKIARGDDGKEEKKKKEKKKGKWWMGLGIAGLLFGGDAIKLGKKIVPQLFNSLIGMFFGDKSKGKKNILQKGVDLGKGATNLGVKGALGTAKGFLNMYQKDANGKVSTDGKISAGIDLFKWFRDKTARKLTVGAAKGVFNMGKGLIKHTPIIGRTLKGLGFAGKYFGAKAAQRLGKDTEKFVFKVVGNTAENVAKESVEATGKSILKNARNAKQIGRITYWMLKALDCLENLIFKIPGVKKFAEKIAKPLVDRVKEFMTKTVEKLASKFVGEAAEKAGKKGILGTIKGALTSGVVTAAINLGFIAWDAWQGAKKAKDFFAIDKDDKPTKLQQWACAITYGAMSLIECVPGCVIVTAVLSSIDSFMKECCFFVYNCLNQLLTNLGAGDSAMEVVEQKILQNKQQDTSDNSNTKSAITKDTAMKMNEVQLQMQKEGRTPEEIHSELKRIAREGGKGYTSPVTGKAVTNNAPNFVSQRSLPNVQVGKLHAQVDGCALAVMKMIAQSKNYNISDNVLISKMREYTLANKSVSVGFFKDFGAQITDKKDDIKNALNSGFATMALLIRNKGYQHFIAVIAKDQHKVYVGDPLKDSWEIMSNNDHRLLTYAVAAGIFSGSVSSSLQVVKKGGRGVGGFGSKSKENSFTGMVARAANTILGGITNIFNNGSAEPEWEQDSGSTNTNDGIGSLSGDSLFRYVRAQQAINENGWMSANGNSGNTLFGIDGRQNEYARKKYGITEANVANMSFDTADKIWHDWWVASKLGNIKHKEIAFAMFDILGHGPAYTGGETASVLNQYGIHANNTKTQWVAGPLATFSDEMINAINQVPADKAKEVAHGINAIHWNKYGYGKTRKKGNDNFIDTGVPGYGDGMKTIKYKGVTYTPTITGVEKSGGNGGEALYWGRGAYGGATVERLKKVFTSSSWVEGRLKLPKNTACGLAVGLMIQKLIFPSQETKFTPEEMHAWAKRSGAYDKNMGVSQHFFLRMGLKDLKLDKIAESVNSGVKGKIILGELVYGKWKLQPGEIAVIGENGHWYILMKPFAGPNQSQNAYIADPNAKSIEPMSIWKKNQLIDYVVRVVNIGSIVNILSGTGMHIKGMSGGYGDGTLVSNTTGKSQNGKVNDGSGSRVADAAAAEIAGGSADGGTNSNGGGAESKPNKGSSTSFGGWFYKDKEGNIQQAFFGSLTKKVRGASTGNSAGNVASGIISGATGAAFPMMKDTISLPIIPAMKLKDGDKPFEAAKACVAGAQPKSISKCREYTVKALIKAGYPSALQTTWRQGSQDRAAGRGLPEGPNSNVDKQVGLPPDYGFTMISVQSPPQPGDVCIIWPFGSHRSGHVQMYCGPEAGAKQSGWVSDFDQRRSTPYSESQLNNGYGRRITLYRDSNYCAKPTGMSGGGSVPTNATTTPQQNNNKAKPGGQGKGGDTDLKDVTNTVANYYSKGSKSYNTSQVVRNTIEEVKKTPDTVIPGTVYSEKERLGANGRPIKEFHMVHDPKRNMNREMRDRMAKAKYDREMRKIQESNHYKRWGVFDVMYKNKDDVVEKTLSTMSGYLQDVETKSPLLNALMRLSGSLVDNAVQTRNGTKELLAMAEQQTEVLEIQRDATKDTSKSLEKKDNINHTIFINSQGKAMNAGEITESFLKMFVTQTTDAKTDNNLFNQS